MKKVRSWLTINICLVRLILFFLILISAKLITFIINYYTTVIVKFDKCQKLNLTESKL